ncbi:MAG: hypothetical protein U5K33_06700 [Halofilum sp. (in: g-proteobacteria)]|nr:hypothetical protein [Halofilum sp. (in: g-proteobacteria)]
MEITDLKSGTTADGKTRISAMMDSFELWYELPLAGNLPETVADSFAIMGLAPSMLDGRPLRIASGFPISGTLLKNFETIQKIFNCWNPAFQLVPVEASVAAPAAATRWSEHHVFWLALDFFIRSCVMVTRDRHGHTGRRLRHEHGL